MFDVFALYTLCILISILVVAVRRRFAAVAARSDETDRVRDDGVDLPAVIRNHTMKRRSCPRQPPEIENLRLMSIEELGSLNRRHMHGTDRYWREIFRRFNSDLPPDNVNLNMLSSQNALTVLQEVLPRSGLHAAENFVINGTGVRHNSEVHCEVLKYLRKRFASCAEYQIEVDVDDDSVTLIHAK